MQHPFIHRTRSVRIILDLIQRTKEAVRKSDRLEASRIQKLIMFQSSRPHHSHQQQPAPQIGHPHTAKLSGAVAATDRISRASPSASPDPVRPPPPRPARQSTLTQNEGLDDVRAVGVFLKNIARVLADSACCRFRAAKAQIRRAKREVWTVSSRARSARRRRHFRVTRHRRQQSRTTRATIPLRTLDEVDEG